MRMVTLVALAAVVLLASGCATLTKGASQTVTVSTDPPGANCELTRDAKPLAVVNPTPGSVSISKGSGVIAIVCRKDKFQDAAGTMASEFQAMTFGNILFGGLIGVVVDAASGATHEYPPLVTITLIPEVFASIAERDAFYERMRQSLQREAAAVKERIANECRNLAKATSPAPKLMDASSDLPAQCRQETGRRRRRSAREAGRDRPEASPGQGGRAVREPLRERVLQRRGAIEHRPVGPVLDAIGDEVAVPLMASGTSRA